MMLMGKKQKNWDKIRRRPTTETFRNRDVYESQQLDRSHVGEKKTFTSRHIIAIVSGLLSTLLLWALWSIYDISRLNNESAAEANVAVVITEPAPDEPRNLADVTWANMILVEDNTYAKYGYTYMDKRTGVKYTQAEYNIWLSVHQRINSGQCPELLVRANADGTYTYKERDPIAPPPAEPRKWSHADMLNFLQRGVVADNCYADMGYCYKEKYKGNYLTQAEYDALEPYRDNEYIKQLVSDGLIIYEKIDIQNEDGAPRTVYYFEDVTEAQAVIPTEPAGNRYSVPIELDDLTWVNMKLVSDKSAVSLGYPYRDTRTGLFYTAVEYEKWRQIYKDALYGRNGYAFWMDVSEDDNSYVFSEKPPGKASSEPRKLFLNFLDSDLMKMNLVENSFWSEYGYNYYDYYTLLFYSDAEYQIWLDVQNKVAAGTLHIPKKTQSEIRQNNIKVTSVISEHLDPLPVTHDYAEAFASVYFMKILCSGGVGLIVYGLLKTLLKKNLEAQNLMNDTSDINQYQDDQHIALPEEVQRKFDWFPDVGAHCPVQVSSMISHAMLTNKGLNKIKLAKRAPKDIVDEDGDVIYYEGDILCNDNGEPITELVPLIDSAYADALYEASGAPKEVRKYYDANKIPYNPDGKDRTKQMGVHKTVADAINKTWTFPLYEPQRPAGAYLVDTEPVNTMV